MSKLNKLKFINNTSKAWKVMFELYDWLRWSNENGYDCCADYMEFLRICEDEILRLNLDIDSIPAYTNDDNWVSRWFYLEGKFKNIRDMQKLIDHDEYKIFMIRKQVQVRFKDYGERNSFKYQGNRSS